MNVSFLSLIDKHVFFSSVGAYPAAHAGNQYATMHGAGSSQLTKPQTVASSTASFTQCYPTRGPHLSCFCSRAALAARRWAPASSRRWGRFCSPGDSRAAAARSSSPTTTRGQGLPTSFLSRARCSPVFPRQVWLSIHQSLYECN